MNSEPHNRYFGTSITEWIERVPNELDVDAVGLWQIIGSGQDGFDLKGDLLTNFVMLCVISLLEKGATPVRASENPSEFWVPDNRYMGDIQQIAKQIVGDWISSGVDPDHDGLWFAKLD